jgi:hypothetical protein
MIANFVERGEVEFEPSWIREDHQQRIEDACNRLGVERYKTLNDALPEEFTYDEIKLVVAHLRQTGGGLPA